MVHYIQPNLLIEACSPESPTHNLGNMLVEVIATVLDNDVSKNVFVPFQTKIRKYQFRI